MNTILQTPLTTLSSNLTALLSTLTTSPTAATAPSQTEDLLAADQAITRALQTLQTHQANYARILALRREVEELEQRVKDRVRRLDALRAEAVAAGGGSLDSDDESDSDEESGRGKDGVDYRVLMAFARRIGRFPDPAAATTATAVPPTLRRANTANGASSTLVDANLPSNTPFSALKSLDTATTTWLDYPSLMHDLGLAALYPDAEKIRSGLLGKVQLAVEDGQDGESLVRGWMGDTTAVEAEVKTEMDPEASLRSTSHPTRLRRESVNFGAKPSVAGRGGMPVPVEEKKSGLNLALWDPEDDEED